MYLQNGDVSYFIIYDGVFSLLDMKTLVNE